jgi:hypothetical protein
VLPRWCRARATSAWATALPPTAGTRPADPTPLLLLRPRRVARHPRAPRAPRANSWQQHGDADGFGDSTSGGLDGLRSDAYYVNGRVTQANPWAASSTDAMQRYQEVQQARRAAAAAAAAATAAAAAGRGAPAAAAAGGGAP